jgi:hypothetical protein
MKVGERTGDVSCKGKSETPGQRLGFVMDVLAEVTWEDRGQDMESRARNAYHSQ